ncbi:amidohydrolase 2 [Phanerochaete sordida]|uniref:Amidohydrolase 2 n=1 Tax=Phanerochaete sordida TaxID=48140 RepID=A0A9P3FW67_9APHY|nr:amidohydrolase 2 [Phanerochaete sordida]
MAHHRSLKVDVHHHIFLPELAKRKADQNAAVGWKTPPDNMPWSIQKSLEAMNKLGVAYAVLSYPAGIPENLIESPFHSSSCGASDLLPDEEEMLWEKNRKVVRELNTHAKGLCDAAEAQGRFGWFACLPDLRNVEGALREIAYALDVLRADGVSLSSSYGQGSGTLYIGADRFEPVWAELARRGAVVFVHGTQTPSAAPHPHACLGLPVTAVPGETFKAAAHLVVAGTKARHAGARVVLAHCGGSAPCLAPRVAALAAHMGSGRTPEACLADFATFFVETALCGHGPVLQLAESMFGRSRMLFGTDFPAVSMETIEWFTNQLEAHYADDAAALEEVTSRTALELFPRFQVKTNKANDAAVSSYNEPNSKEVHTQNQNGAVVVSGGQHDG